MTRTHLLSKTIFGAAVAASLGFGAAQAAARPAPAGTAACLDARCFLECVRRGYDGGACTAAGGCSCYYVTP